MKLNFAIGAVILALASTSYAEIQCVAKKCQTLCTASDGGRDGTPTKHPVTDKSSQTWCYLRSGADSTTGGDIGAMQCSGNIGCADSDAAEGCLKKDDDESMGGCTTS
ncbi:hypothetical protein NUU61_002116 [Penicillium alfredii]|uniref:Uncharacterized protein n=1 Tax=Penicillium alfredii TaxID=1506179 RepID=A0A9W9FQZ1_9EURO|nr:uncharacterized protein NUU61_002116 [Penicillium alfredii]KAJ5104769.1 hypothetical protein NUU61_002116 [Penicillium alfredii]